MKTILYFRAVVVALAVVGCAAIACAASAVVTAELDHSNLTLGESAQLTVTTSGGADREVSAPEVPGLDIVQVSQSSQFQSINGVDTSNTSVTYQVTPQRVGNFTIPALSPGSRPVVLQVRSGSMAAPSVNNQPSSSLPPPAGFGSSEADTRTTPDGAAFVRLRLPKQQLYVGETVPVDIQVGLRPGLVASLNGLPTLNGDAFTLNKLSSEPERAEQEVDGKPYTVLTWHSALAAIKPGDFSITVETPLTVQMRTKPRRSLSMGGDFDSQMDSMFDDSFLQNFFGGTTEKQITAASDPIVLTVQALPVAGRPAQFSGAVGNFNVSSELSTESGAAGDPLTLRLKVSGTGDFARVKSPMLGKTKDWKTYPPTANFVPADNADYSGEKVFEQAIIPLQPGRQTVPPLEFSFFNPSTHRYETKITNRHALEISAASTASPVASNPVAINADVSASGETPSNGLRPDHVETGDTTTMLLPLYFQPWFLGTQSALVLCFAAGLVFQVRRERRSRDADAIRRREASDEIARCLSQMDRASAAADSKQFFQSARSALQQKLAARWHVAPPSITIAEIDSRLNGDETDVRRIFALADQAAYSQENLSTADFRQWKETVRHQLETVDTP